MQEIPFTKPIAIIYKKKFLIFLEAAKSPCHDERYIETAVNTIPTQETSTAFVAKPIQKTSFGAQAKAVQETHTPFMAKPIQETSTEAQAKAVQKTSSVGETTSVQETSNFSGPFPSSLKLKEDPSKYPLSTDLGEENIIIKKKNQTSSMDTQTNILSKDRQPRSGYYASSAMSTGNSFKDSAVLPIDPKASSFSSLRLSSRFNSKGEEDTPLGKSSLTVMHKNEHDGNLVISKGSPKPTDEVSSIQDVSEEGEIVQANALGNRHPGDEGRQKLDFRNMSSGVFSQQVDCGDNGNKIGTGNDFGANAEPDTSLHHIRDTSDGIEISGSSTRRNKEAFVDACCIPKQPMSQGDLSEKPSNLNHKRVFDSMEIKGVLAGPLLEKRQESVITSKETSMRISSTDNTYANTTTTSPEIMQFSVFPDGSSESTLNDSATVSKCQEKYDSHEAYHLKISVHCKELTCLFSSLLYWFLCILTNFFNMGRKPVFPDVRSYQVNYKASRMTPSLRNAPQESGCSPAKTHEIPEEKPGVQEIAPEENDARKTHGLATTSSCCQNNTTSSQLADLPGKQMKRKSVYIYKESCSI